MASKAKEPLPELMRLRIEMQGIVMGLRTDITDPKEHEIVELLVDSLSVTGRILDLLRIYREQRGDTPT